MLQYPQINPIAFHLGPLPVRWYGLMYLIGFAAAWWLAYRQTLSSRSTWNRDQVADLICFAAYGVILGGRLGYVLFYEFSAFIKQPWIVIKIWQGGMSFHGGLIGVILAMLWFARKYRKTFLEVTDFIAPLVPIGLGAGRLGNFINGELWGRVTQVPWAMVFPHVDKQLRHPSPLYEFLLEGVVLFIVLQLYKLQPRPRGAISGLFLLLYGVFRFTIEFVRQPDMQLGFIAFDWMTMGQLLSIPMILVGSYCIWRAYYTHCTSKCDF
ncbi:MAG: prolipoprotein diacylglyceryl transferase [Gammaproteobacteria bacterium]